MTAVADLADSVGTVAACAALGVVAGEAKIPDTCCQPEGAQ